jgi:hypothetical protein
MGYTKKVVVTGNEVVGQTYSQVIKEKAAIQASQNNSEVVDNIVTGMAQKIQKERSEIFMKAIDIQPSWAGQLKKLRNKRDIAPEYELVDGQKRKVKEARQSEKLIDEILALESKCSKLEDLMVAIATDPRGDRSIEEWLELDAYRWNALDNLVNKK